MQIILSRIISYDASALGNADALSFGNSPAFSGI